MKTFFAFFGLSVFIALIVIYFLLQGKCTVNISRENQIIICKENKNAHLPKGL